MKPAIRNVFSLCGALVVQVCGFHVDEWQAISDIVKMKGMACQMPEHPVVNLTPTMWAGHSKGTEAMAGFAKNQDCAAITKNIKSLSIDTLAKARTMVNSSQLDCIIDQLPCSCQKPCGGCVGNSDIMSISGLSKEAGESQRESDQQDCAAITENITSLTETKSKARVMVYCSQLDCIINQLPCSCQKPCGSCIGNSDIMSISGVSKEAGGSQRESDQQDCAAMTENMTSLAETKSKAWVMVDCSTLDCIVDEMPALHERCCKKQSAVKECTKMVGGQSKLFGFDSWWLVAILICVVQGCWKWTDRGSVRPWGRGWWLTMASLAVAEGIADTWYELSPTGGLSGTHYGGVAVWSTTDNRMYVFGGYTGSYIDTLIAYDPQANEWKTISPSSGTAPSIRTNCRGGWDETLGRMWIFGGGASGVKYNDLHYYDVAGNAWVAVSPSGTAPTARSSHVASFDSTNNRLWVFGGSDGSNRNDLHYYDVQANQWFEVSPGGTAPTARNTHSAAWDSTNSRFWVFGGADGTWLNDLHYYDVQANQWFEVSPGGTAPTGRYGQKNEWDDAGGRLWMIAGKTESAGDMNDLFYYDVQANQWVEVNPGGATLSVRAYHHSAIDASTGRLYVYGGTGGGGVTLFYTEIKDQTTTTTVSSSATRTATSSTTRTITTSTTQTISSSTTVTGSTTGTTTTTRTGSTTTTRSSSTSISTTISTSSSTSTATSSSTRTSTTTSSSTSRSSSTTTTSLTTSTSTSTASTSTSRSTTTSSGSSTTSTTVTSTSMSKTISTTTSSTSTATKTSTQSSTTTKTVTTATTTHTTATHSTTTTSSISSSTTSHTTTTETGTAIPKAGLTAEELEALEDNRKEEAAQAVAAVEAAENTAVAEAIAAIALQGSNASAPSAPGILGEVTISSEAGPVKVAALSLEAMGNDSVPAKVSAGETGAELEVSAGLLGEVAAAAGSDVVLLSVAGLPKDAASRLATDDVRAKSPDPSPPGPGGARRLASALRSQPLSINFRAADGTKININNLTTPMRMTLTVEDPKATCAFWDEATAQWSSKGVQTIPSEIPGILMCETTHLSIFGGVIDVALRNFILALECSTVGDLLTGKAIAKMVEDGEWLGRPATLFTLAVAVGFLGLLKLALRSDQRFQEILPWSEREDFLMCVKAKPSRQDPRAGAAGAGVADAVEQPPQNDAEQHGKMNDKGADEVQREDEQPRENRGDEEVKSEEKEEERKDEAAGGLEELPSIFRTVRGIVEGLLDTISQALGGENVLDSIKEVISNAESSTIHRAIASLQSHRSGADQATVRALQRGDTLWASDSEEELDDDAEGKRRRDATSKPTEGSAEDLPLEGEKSVLVADEERVADEEALGRRKTSVVTLDVQSVNSDDSADRREASAVHEAVPVREDGGAEVQGESRQPRPRASMVEMIGAAFRAARKSVKAAKARAMHGRVAEDGAGAAKRYLEGNIISRALMLFPAVHNWLKLAQFSIVVPCVIRTELIELKVWSCACLNAAFFSSTIPAPDSDPACRPEAGSLEYWSQKVGVGVVSATAGDLIILLLFLLVRIKIEERDEWTDEDKDKWRARWRRRTIAFWIIAVLYKSFCIFYVCDFIANVSKEDARQLLEATAVSLLQDLVLKPALLAIILSVVSTLVLGCRPSVERKVEAKWIEDGSVERATTEDLRGSSIPSDACKASDVKEEGDGQQPLRPVGDPNEAQFAGVLPGMPEMP